MLPGICLRTITNVLRLNMLMAASLWGAGVLASPLLDQMNAQYQREFGIEIVADRETYPIAGTGGSIDAINTGVNDGDMVLYFLRKEFAKYPPELLKRAGVKRIVLCKELKRGSVRIAGIAVEKTGSIYVDSTTKIGDESHRRRTLHHELFHFMDYARGDVMHNAAWEAVNKGGPAYGSPPPPQKPGQRNWASHPAPGFVSDYSLTALPEDRAELFAALMTNNLTLRLLVQRDFALATKVKILKEELLQFCPQADEAFWTRMAAF